MDKQAFRKMVRRVKPDTASSFLIIQKLLQNAKFRSAATVLMYYSLPDEPFTHDIINSLEGKTVLLPRVVDAENMEIRQYTGSSDMQMGAFGILEPTGPVVSDYAAIDVAVVPGIAFDRQCHRMGRGRGYYDRFLAPVPSIHKIGICFPERLFDAIPFCPHDVVMDEVVTL